MSAIAEKLKYRKGGVTHEINLYNSVSDMGGREYLSLYVDGSLAYAPLGATSDPEASDLRVRKGGATKAVLNTAIVSIPSGIIRMSMTACPSGWTRVSAFDGKYLRGASPPGGSGGGGSHTHSVTIPASSSANASPSRVKRDLYIGGSYDSDSTATTTHNHDFNADVVVSGSGTVLPEYKEIIFCKKD